MNGNLAAEVLNGDRLALARLLTQVENETAQSLEALNELYPHTGQAYLLGVTGAGGTGKSTLVNRLVQSIRQGNGDSTEPHLPRVAVIAVDPSSPFSGGALLGDRLRMRDLAGDSGVFIRSLATRGARGGLARAAASMAQIFDAAGYEMIVIETVGAGQTEVDIAGLAHSVVVVEAPGMGDDIQANKAGLMEIADILVVNKGDRPGADQTERTLRAMIEISTSQITAADRLHHAGESSKGELQPTNHWQTPIIRTTATIVGGADELLEAVKQHRKYLEKTGEHLLRDRKRLKQVLDESLQQAVFSRWQAAFGGQAYQTILEAVWDRRLSPQSAVHKLLGKQPADSP
jgi:LAO/AO transport system kinase